jgi:aminopeptidase N
VDFFVSHFGPPGIPELNLLVQGESFNGGCSFGGYLINFLRRGDGPTAVPQTERLPPMFLNDSRWDSLIHEIAHQWWGGLVSWQKTDDAWISEGLTQYSTLLYLHDSLAEKKFIKLLERMCAGVVQKAAAGKTTETVNLAFVKKDPVAYQVIVYNKSALIFWMLQDLLGEKKMLAKLKRLLKERHFQCLGSEEFIQYMAADDQLLKQFLAGWVGRAEVPAVSYRISNQGRTAWLEVNQGNWPFVFPLQVCCRMKSGIKRLLLTIHKERESFVLAMNNALLQSIEIGAGQIPVMIGNSGQ